MVTQVTETEPTMAKSNCWSRLDGGKFWLPKVGTWLRAPAGKREAVRFVTGPGSAMKEEKATAQHDRDAEPLP